MPLPDYQVVRTNRKKTAAVRIVDGRVEIVVPKRLSLKKIEAIILKKSSWIQKKLQAQSELVPVKPKNYASGEVFTYLGKNYPLKLIMGDCTEVKLKHGCLTMGVREVFSNARNERYIKENLTRWYKSRAEQQLRQKTARYSDLLGVQPRAVIVKNYRARWGSCSIHGDISYNWKIIMAPGRIVDYLVVHELCHMLQHNHSPAFWLCVERFCPDYRECRQWLKENGSTLEI